MLLRPAVLPPILARLAFALVAACLLGPCPSARAAWTPEATGATGSSLQAIACPSSATCFAVQDGAARVRKVAGGTWGPTAATGSSATLYGIGCWDPAHCLAAGAGGTLLYTGDGGDTWAAETGPDAATTLYGVSCPAAGTCVAVGAGGAVWSSSTVGDGAAAGWAAQSAGSATLNAVACVTATDCWAAGASIYTNRGGTWAIWRIPVK